MALWGGTDFMCDPRPPSAFVQQSTDGLVYTGSLWFLPWKKRTQFVQDLINKTKVWCFSPAPNLKNIFHHPGSCPTNAAMETEFLLPHGGNNLSDTQFPKPEQWQHMLFQAAGARPTGVATTLQGEERSLQHCLMLR